MSRDVERWAATRCQHQAPAAVERFCEATAQRTCGRCGRRLCALHDYGDELAPECAACRLARLSAAR